MHLGAWDELDVHHDPLQLAAILERRLEDTERSINGGFDDLVWFVSLKVEGGCLPTRSVKGQDVSSAVPPMSSSVAFAKQRHTLTVCAIPWTPLTASSNAPGYMCDDTAAPSAADEQERHLPGSRRAHLSDVPDDRVREGLVLEQINQVVSLVRSKRATPSATTPGLREARKRARAHLRLRPNGPDHLEPLLQQLVDNVDSHEARGAGHEDLRVRSSQSNIGK